MMNNKILTIYFKVFIVSHIFSSADGVIGGGIAPDQTYRYQVSVLYKDDHICSGSLISLRHVLTSAQCVSSFKKTEDYTVLSGITRFNDCNGKISIVEEIKIAKFSETLNNTHQTINDGIVILTLHELLECNEYTAPIKFVENSLNFPPSALFLFTGWGHPTPNHETDSQKLKYIYLKPGNSTDCTEYFYCIFRTQSDEENSILDPSSVDNGGALIFNNMIIGVLSTVPVASSPTLILFSKIHHHAQNIKSILYWEWPAWTRGCYRPDKPWKNFYPIGTSKVDETLDPSKHIMLKRTNSI